MNKDIIFNILDFNSYHNNDEEDDDSDIENDNSTNTGEYTIELFGRTKNDKSVYVKVNGFTPYFYVDIPDNWNDSHVDKFVNYIKNKVYYKYRDNLVAYDIQLKHKLCPKMNQ